MVRPDENGTSVDTAAVPHGNGKSHLGMPLSGGMAQNFPVRPPPATQERSRLALLYDINRRLANAANWGEVVDLVVRVPAEVVDAVGCVFLSFDKRTERLVLEKLGVENRAQAAASAVQQGLVPARSPED